MAVLIPHLSIRNAAAAIEFYKKAFDAVEVSRVAAPDGKRLLHASLTIHDAPLMLADEFPEYGGCKSPQSLGGTAVVIHMNSPDVDKAMAKAVAAGAEVRMPATDMFWGDRYGMVRDPFGHEWSIATTLKKMTPREIEAAGAEAFAKFKPGGKENCGS